MFKEWTLRSYSHANRLSASVGDFASGDLSVINVKNCSLSTTYNDDMTHRKQQK